MTIDTSVWDAVQVALQPGIGPALFNGMNTAVDRVLVAAPGSKELNNAQVPCMSEAGTHPCVCC